MRITHVINSVDPSYGGPAVVAPRLSAAQAAAGHEVQILTCQTQKTLDELAPIFQDIPNHERVTYKQIPRPRSPFGFPRSRQTDRQMQEAIKASDFIHMHGIWSQELLAVGINAHDMSIPYAVRPAGMLDPWSLQQKSLKKKLALLTGRKAWLDRAAFIHTLNNDESRLIKTGSLNLTCPVEVIPNGIFLDEIQEQMTENAFRDQYRNFLGDSPFVLFLSRLHYKKGLIHLAEAFSIVCKHNRELKLVVAGPDEGDRAVFEQKINSYGIGERVLVPGPIYGSAKYDALREACCFCLPSFQEGFSLAILESLGCGTPAVITHGCHFPEVETANAGRVVEQDAKQIANVILEIAGQPQVRKDMSKAARNLVASLYTWPKIADLTVETYRKHLDSNTQLV